MPSLKLPVLCLKNAFLTNLNPHPQRITLPNAGCHSHEVEQLPGTNTYKANAIGYTLADP